MGSVTVLAPHVAVSTTVVGVPAGLVVTVNGARNPPAATVTGAGGGTSVGSELLNVTSAPPAGAAPLSTTAPLAPNSCRRFRDGGSTVSGIDTEPVGSVAVIVTVVGTVTCRGSMVNVPSTSVKSR